MNYQSLTFKPELEAGVERFNLQASTLNVKFLPQTVRLPLQYQQD